MSDSLRILAVSAPQWPRRPPNVKVRSLHAEDPFSLQNAMRHAAGVAETSGTAWKDSNWHNLSGRQGSTLLHEFCDDEIVEYRRQLRVLRPNIVFIGAMSLSFPGAIRYAAEAKKAASDPEDVLVVLGGKHCNETVFGDGDRIQLLGCSPVKLMERGLAGGGIPPIFDVVVSGEAEEVVTALGEMVVEALRSGRQAAKVRHELGALPNRAGGNWVVAAVNREGHGLAIQSNRRLDFAHIPTAASAFGVHSRFPVFGTDFTGHAYSDTGPGCVMNCFFCSERRDVNGSLRRVANAPWRLIQHFQDITQIIPKQKSGATASVFVEDSIFLGGSPKLMSQFADLLEQNPRCQVPFGVQLTVDFVRRPEAEPILRRLKSLGLGYAAIGVETWSERLAEQMDKHKPGPVWSRKTEDAMKVLAERLELNVGVYILWGWGEDQHLRQRMVTTLAEWQNRYKQPCSVGLNWLTRHPLRGCNHLLPTLGKRDFVEWGTPYDSAYLPYFVEMFGEASVNYCLPQGDFAEKIEHGSGLAPTPDELRTLMKAYRALPLKQ